ncbi:MAG: ester cyclase [Opitutaceae bacterium]
MKKTSVSLYILPATAAAATILLTASIAQAGAGVSAEARAGAAAWQAAFNSGDEAAGGALYAEDGILMAPNVEPIVGRAAIGQTFGDGKKNGYSILIHATGSESSGDLGYVEGTWESIDASGSVIDDGKYVEVRKVIDGQSLIIRDIYNSNRPAVPADMGSTTAAVSTFIGVWNSKDYSKLDAIIAPDFKRDAPGDLTDASDLAGLKEVMQALHTAYPDFAITMDKLDCYNGGGVIRWTVTGTNTGPGDEPPTGKAVKISGMTTVAMVDGKIAEEYVQFDVLGWQLQLGKTVQ